MSIGKVTVLKLSFGTLSDRFPEASDVASPIEGEWTAQRGESGAVFFAAAIADGSLVVPFDPIDDAEDLALHLRELLGRALDDHDDDRGIFVSTSLERPAGDDYAAIVATEGTWLKVVAADDPRLAKKEGWAFSAAADALNQGSPDAAKRTGVKRDPEDALETIKERVEGELDARNDRDRLRGDLSAGLTGKIEDSIVGELLERLPPVPKKETDVLVKGASSDARTTGALEGLLKDVIEEGIAPNEAGEPAPDATSSGDEKKDG